MRTPTPKQAERLHILAAGYALLAPRRGEWAGPFRYGWVEAATTHTPRGGVLPILRITEAGRAALALATRPEDQCSETTSAPHFPSAAASGARLPSLRSIGSGRTLPARAWTRPSCSSGSVLARTSPIRTAPLQQLPTGDVVDNEVLEAWRRLEDGAERSRRRGGYNAGHRCWSCRRFIGGPEATCGHCGQRHGGIYHEAGATR